LHLWVTAVSFFIVNWNINHDVIKINIPHRPEVLEAVRIAARDGRITCTQARKIAAELKVVPKMVGNDANELKIRINRSMEVWQCVRRSYDGMQ
jgi:glutamate formiminotransferase